MNAITLSVIWGALVSCGEEMGVALSRTAYSNAVKDGQDFSCAVFGPDARLVAQGDFSPGHLGGMLYGVQRAVARFQRNELRDGDTLVLNDVEMGTGHFPDIMMITPVFHGRELIGYVANCAHHVDMGGAVPGSQIVENVNDYFQEGLRILPVKYMEEGSECHATITFLRANVRLPEKVLGDLRAQANANALGAERLRSLAERYGAETLRQAMDRIISMTEVHMRDAIRNLPEGEYTFEDFLDDCGPGTDPIRVRVTARIAHGEIELDFEGSSEQTKTGLNSYLNYTMAYSLCAVKSIVLPKGAANAGMAIPIKFNVPEGSFFNPTPPAGGSARATINPRIFEVVMAALGQAVPERVMAAVSHFSNPNISGRDDKTGKTFIFYDLIMGGTGARPDRDAAEALTYPYNGTNIPVEVQESSAPVLVRCLQIIPDSGGAGKFRGSVGLKKDIRVNGTNLGLSNLTDRCVYPPFGFAGGKPGRCGSTIINPDTDSTAVPSKIYQALSDGDVISFRLSGGGGYGDPFERSIEAVQKDVSAGYVSLEGARRDYGVVIEPATLKVDLEATLKVRSAAPHTT
jgi:N-methylhydantoinase B